MRTVQLKKSKNTWEYLTKKTLLKNPLVLVLGNRFLLEDKNIYQEIKEMFPDGHIVFGSSGGEISLNTINDNSITITAIEFEKSHYKIETCNILKSNLNSYQTGEKIINKLPAENLKFVFIISEGSFINASNFVEGMNSVAIQDTIITGGLCGDDERFEKTYASYNENPKEGELVAIGFYGDTIEVTSSVDNGWIPFGPERKITKSKDNILYEIDGKPALNLYKKYLGDKAKELPISALMYPLSIKIEGEKNSFIRGTVGINEDDSSMIHAGNVPENSTVQLTMSTIDRLVDSSELTIKNALEKRKKKPQLAILVSCMGRKLIFNERVEEEIEDVLNILGKDTTVCGFYAYGEFSPLLEGKSSCQLHNQTMAVTLFSE